jgi:hypothetical protein
MGRLRQKWRMGRAAHQFEARARDVVREKLPGRRWRDAIAISMYHQRALFDPSEHATQVRVAQDTETPAQRVDAWYGGAPCMVSQFMCRAARICISEDLQGNKTPDRARSIACQFTLEFVQDARFHAVRPVVTAREARRCRDKRDARNLLGR